jgi:putative two-component system response regulator
MKTHTVLGSNAIAQAEADAEKPVEFLSMAKMIARSHHEKWDGSGYLTVWLATPSRLPPA